MSTYLARGQQRLTADILVATHDDRLVDGDRLERVRKSNSLIAREKKQASASEKGVCAEQGERSDQEDRFGGCSLFHQCQARTVVAGES